MSEPITDESDFNYGNLGQVWAGNRARQALEKLEEKEVQSG